jgi:hypothetical protein
MKKTFELTTILFYPRVLRACWVAVFSTSALVLTLAPVVQSQAASINYGNFSGTTVDYQMVTESSSTDPGPLFGAPTVSGDTLDFNPVGFSASSSNGGAADITDGQLLFMVKAKPGLGLGSIVIDERGDTSLAGFGTDATFTSVSLNGVLNISEVGGVAINTIALPIAFSSIGPSGGTYGLTTDFGGGPGGTIAWNGSALIDLTPANPLVAAAYAAQNLDPKVPVTKISVNFDNTLIALSQAGTSALIAKKDQLIIIVRNPPGGDVPEPASAMLALLTMIGAAVVRRR